MNKSHLSELKSITLGQLFVLTAHASDRNFDPVVLVHETISTFPYGSFWVILDRLSSENLTNVRIWGFFLTRSTYPCSMKTFFLKLCFSAFCLILSLILSLRVATSRKIYGNLGEKELQKIQLKDLG